MDHSNINTKMYTGLPVLGALVGDKTNIENKRSTENLTKSFVQKSDSHESLSTPKKSFNDMDIKVGENTEPRFAKSFKDVATSTTTINMEKNISLDSPQYLDTQLLSEVGEEKFNEINALLDSKLEEPGNNKAASTCLKFKSLFNCGKKEEDLDFKKLTTHQKVLMLILNDIADDKSLNLDELKTDYPILATVIFSVVVMTAGVNTYNLNEAEQYLTFNRFLMAQNTTTGTTEGLLTAFNEGLNTAEGKIKLREDKLDLQHVDSIPAKIIRLARQLLTDCKENPVSAIYNTTVYSSIITLSIFYSIVDAENAAPGAKNVIAEGAGYDPNKDLGTFGVDLLENFGKFGNLLVTAGFGGYVMLDILERLTTPIKNLIKLKHGEPTIQEEKNQNKIAKLTTLISEKIASLDNSNIDAELKTIKQDIMQEFANDSRKADLAGSMVKSMEAQQKGKKETMTQQILQFSTTAFLCGAGAFVGCDVFLAPFLSNMLRTNTDKLYEQPNGTYSYPINGTLVNYVSPEDFRRNHGYDDIDFSQEDKTYLNAILETGVLATGLQGAVLTVGLTGLKPTVENILQDYYTVFNNLTKNPSSANLKKGGICLAAIVTTFGTSYNYLGAVLKTAQTTGSYLEINDAIGGKPNIVAEFVEDIGMVPATTLPLFAAASLSLFTITALDYMPKLMGKAVDAASYAIKNAMNALTDKKKPKEPDVKPLESRGEIIAQAKDDEERQHLIKILEDGTKLEETIV